MARCEYYQHSWGDRCVIKGKLSGSDSDAISDDTYRRYCTYSDGYKTCPFYEQYDKEQNSSGCFLTSACVRAKGLPDDCEELETLRAFRDGWLREQNCGAAVIARYYEIAPGIVSRINATAGADGIWNRIYSEVILPCVEMIRAQRYEQAFDTYQQAVLGLEKQFA